jgi:hypothetical protein
MVIELGGSVFEITHDLVGDLFRAKNAGVTCSGEARTGAWGRGSDVAFFHLHTSISLFSKCFLLL